MKFSTFLDPEFEFPTNENAYQRLSKYHLERPLMGALKSVISDAADKLLSMAGTVHVPTVAGTVCSEAHATAQRLSVSEHCTIVAAKTSVLAAGTSEEFREAAGRCAYVLAHSWRAYYSRKTDREQDSALDFAVCDVVEEDLNAIVAAGKVEAKRVSHVHDAVRALRLMRDS